ncbi:MAG: addiction module antitoxin RelB [Rhizobacter sp.]
MPDLASQLAIEGLKLTPEERVRLLDLLLESLRDDAPQGVQAAWHSEIERRVAAHERGEGVLYDARDVMSEAARLAP